MVGGVQREHGRCRCLKSAWMVVSGESMDMDSAGVWRVHEWRCPERACKTVKYHSTALRKCEIERTMSP